MEKAHCIEELKDQYRHLGFYPHRTVGIAAWDEDARIIRLTRRSKKQSAADVEQYLAAGMIDGVGEYEILGVEMREFFLSSICGG